MLGKRGREVQGGRGEGGEERERGEWEKERGGEGESREGRRGNLLPPCSSCGTCRCTSCALRLRSSRPRCLPKTSFFQEPQSGVLGAGGYVGAQLNYGLHSSGKR